LRFFVSFFFEQQKEKDLSDVYLFAQQVRGGFDEKRIQKKVNSKEVINAQSLLHFLENPHLIPENIKIRQFISMGLFTRV